MNKGAITLTEKQIRAIEQAVAKGHRIELIGTKDGVKITQITRETLKTEQKAYS